MVAIPRCPGLASRVASSSPSLHGPFSRALSDRFDRRRAMVLSELVQAVAIFVNRYRPAADAGVALAVRVVAGQVLQPAAGR
jgi:hypothetical protein